MEQRLLELEARMKARAAEAAGAGDNANCRWFTGIAEALAEIREDVRQGYMVEDRHFDMLIDALTGGI